MFSLSFTIPKANGPLFAIISICSDDALHSDITPMLMLFYKCRLKNVSLIQFEIKHFELVARCLTNGKNTNGFGNNRLITLPGAAFLC